MEEKLRLVIDALEVCVEALWNVPEVGQVYDHQHAGTYLRALVQVKEALKSMEKLNENQTVS